MALRGIELLKSEAVAHEVFTYRFVKGARAAADVLDVPHETVVKSLVFRADDGMIVYRQVHTHIREADNPELDAPCPVERLITYMPPFGRRNHEAYTAQLGLNSNTGRSSQDVCVEKCDSGQYVPPYAIFNTSKGGRMSLERWIDGLQQGGQYSFERSVALRELGLAEASLKRALHRASAQGRILPLRRGFYVIVPLEYRSVGAVPAEWVLEPLMKLLGKPYYVGGLSAAAWHGAAHQRPQEMQVVVPYPVRNIETRAIRIRFLRNAAMEQALTKPRRTQTGDVPVSTPEWTAIDLIRFQRQLGGMDAVATVLIELADALDPDQLARAAGNESTTAYLQRLGWMLEFLGEGRVNESLHELVSQRNPTYVPLNAALDKRSGPRDPRWRVIVNEEPEADL